MLAYDDVFFTVAFSEVQLINLSDKDDWLSFEIPHLNAEVFFSLLRLFLILIQLLVVFKDLKQNIGVVFSNVTLPGGWHCIEGMLDILLCLLELFGVVPELKELVKVCTEI